MAQALAIKDGRILAAGSDGHEFRVFRLSRLR